MQGRLAPILAGSTFTPLYRSYEQGLPLIFHQHLVQNDIVDIAAKHGRFLQQDYRTGDW